MLPWFFELAAFCYDNEIDWGVITNGSTLNKAHVRALLAARPLNIDVSIDSLTAETHDSLRGISGSMAKVRQGVERLVKERQRVAASTVMRLKPTVTRQSLDTLPDIVEWAAHLDFVLVDFSPVRLWRRDQIAALYPQTQQEMHRLKEIIAILIRQKGEGAPIETSIEKLQAMIDHFEGKPSQQGVGQCRVGLRSINIRPNGDVDHCWKFNRIGNVRDANIADIWKASVRKELVTQTVACDKFKTICANSCFAHRTMMQDIKRGLQFIRSGLG